MEQGDAGELHSALRALLAALAREAGLDPAALCSRAAPLDAAASFAHHAEEQAVARAVESRRREFATGRRLAHALLAELGCKPAPLLADARRRPRWPDHVIGSIAHSRRAAAVALGMRSELTGLGIDLEEDGPLTPELAATVLTPVEARRAQALPGDALAWAKVAFCAKECAYKAWSPFLERVLEFEEVEVELDADRARFRARLVIVPPQLHGAGELRGGFARAGGHLLAAALLLRAAN